MLGIGDGRSRATAAAFFNQLPARVAEQIEAVAIDMTTSYELEIKAHCPQAEIVCDLLSCGSQIWPRGHRSRACRRGQSALWRSPGSPRYEIQPLVVAA